MSPGQRDAQARRRTAPGDSRTRRGRPHPAPNRAGESRSVMGWGGGQRLGPSPPAARRRPDALSGRSRPTPGPRASSGHPLPPSREGSGPRGLPRRRVGAAASGLPAPARRRAPSAPDPGGRGGGRGGAAGLTWPAGWSGRDSSAAAPGRRGASAAAA